MSFSMILLILTVICETILAFFAVQGIRKKRLWMMIVFPVLFILVPFIVFFLFSYGIHLM